MYFYVYVGLESVLEPRNLPPDGSSFREIKLKDKMAVLVPPFGYLNLQFFHQVCTHNYNCTAYVQL